MIEDRDFILKVIKSLDGEDEHRLQSMSVKDLKDYCLNLATLRMMCVTNVREILANGEYLTVKKLK